MGSSKLRGCGHQTGVQTLLKINHLTFTASVLFVTGAPYREVEPNYNPAETFSVNATLLHCQDVSLLDCTGITVGEKYFSVK